MQRTSFLCAGAAPAATGVVLAHRCSDFPVAGSDVPIGVLFVAEREKWTPTLRGVALTA
ncbi:MAG: hypothetical protein AAFR38_14775 [Planctomycetota bacterium]